MHLDNDYANDLEIELLKNSVRLSQENLWTVVAGDTSLCLRYKEGKRTEVSIQGTANKSKDFWIILSVEREDITEPFSVKSAKMKIIQHWFVPFNKEPTYEIFDIELGGKIKAEKGLPYGTQSFWTKIQPMLQILDVDYRRKVSK